MTGNRLQDVLRDVAREIPTVDMGPRVSERLRLGRRRRQLAGTTAVVAVTAGTVALSAARLSSPRPGNAAAGSSGSAAVSTGGASAAPATSPSSGASSRPGPASATPTSGAGGASGPATIVYFRQIHLPHHKLVAKLVVVTASGSRELSGIAPGNVMDVSPDGETVAIVGYDTPRTEGPLRLVNLATGAEQIVPGSFTAGQPTWSPDGRSIAIAHDTAINPTSPEASTAISIVDASTRTVRQLDGMYFTDVVSWSPDGTQLAVSNSATGGIDLLNSATGAVVRHLAGTYSLSNKHSWSPDGTRILGYSLADNKPNEKTDILSAADGRIITQLTSNGSAQWLDNDHLIEATGDQARTVAVTDLNGHVTQTRPPLASDHLVIAFRPAG